MSGGGGAGKVYFVLYLAVVLELLIIIVERDEAEEHLQAKQRETMRIVESILSQLQSGAGTEGINTRPQDEITLAPDGVSEANLERTLGIKKIIENRKYLIEVGVTDVSQDLQQKTGETEKEFYERVKKLILLGNVQDLEYQIFYNPDDQSLNAPDFPSEQYFREKKIDFKTYPPGQIVEDDKGGSWQFRGIHVLKLDQKATFEKLNMKKLSMESFNPIYPKEQMINAGEFFTPPDVPADSFFFYSAEETKKQMGAGVAGDLKKRAFLVNFQPDRSRGGWYKLRFSSRTNRILGVSSDRAKKPLDEETKVNIGTVQLTVKDLIKVEKTLLARLETYKPPDPEVLIKEQNIDKFDKQLREAKKRAEKDEDAKTVIANLDLYGYIVKLLAPGMSFHFPQNLGAIEFNIRVIKPTPPDIGGPTVTLQNDAVRGFDKAQASCIFNISPYKPNENQVRGEVLQNGAVVAEIKCQPYAAYRGGTPQPDPQNNSLEYVGIVNKDLPMGQYQYKIYHTHNGKTAIGTGDMMIFESALTDESKKFVDGGMGIKATYGSTFFISAVPKSTGIPANQFRIYLKTDVYGPSSQREYYEGLDVPRESGLPINAEANTVDIRITWKDPITQQEVELYKNSAEIRQPAPSISDVKKTVTYKQIDMETIRMDIEGITVTSSRCGVSGDDYADLNVNVDGDGEVEGMYKTDKYKYKVTVSGSPTRTSDKEQTVSAEITLKSQDGKIPNKIKQLRLQGTITLNVTASAKNLKNPQKKTSTTVKKAVYIDVNFVPSREKKSGGN